jgi:hypothetical protein
VLGPSHKGFDSTARSSRPSHQTATTLDTPRPPSIKRRIAPSHTHTGCPNLFSTKSDLSEPNRFEPPSVVVTCVLSMLQCLRLTAPFDDWFDGSAQGHLQQKVYLLLLLLVSSVGTNKVSFAKGLVLCAEFTILTLITLISG